MSEEPLDEAEHVKFRWQAEPGGRGLCILATYGSSRLHLDFTDDGGTGTRDMQKVIATMPVIFKFIRQEVMIEREAGELDKDLFDLLGDDDA